MKVINNEGEIEQFEPKRIKNKIIQETNLSEREAEKIKNTVVKLIHKTYKEDINTTTIRSLVNAQLVKRGLLDEESKSRKLGLSVDEFENLISVHCKDNANIQHGAPHRTAGIKVFRCGHKIHMIPLKHLHHLGKIQHASADTVKLVNNDFADFSALNICQHSLKIRSVGVLAAESVILIDSKVLSPCFVSTHLDL